MCKTEDKSIGKVGGIIPLNGGWQLNHYGGAEGFLGWLVLSPKACRKELTDLSKGEACALGGIIQKIDRILREYWLSRFGKKDPILRVYVVYFFESTGYNLHLHLIPRPKSFSCAFSTGKPAWDTPKLTKCWDDFPEKYRIRSRGKSLAGCQKIEEEGKVKDLMASIKRNLKKLVN